MLTHHTKSHTGIKRSVNEDYSLSSKTSQGILFVVCDGMGGHANGKVASKMACEAAVSFFKENHTLSAEELLKQCIKRVNDVVFTASQQRNELAGMGTTIVLALIQKNKLYYANVGDSRLYLVRNNVSEQLSQDHSYPRELLNAGIITEEEYITHPRKNELTRVIGIRKEVKPAVCQIPIILEKGDSILLCTDGLFNMLDDKTIKQTLVSKAKIENKVTQLIENSNKAGGKDNITVCLIEVGNEQKNRLWKWLIGIFVTLLLGVLLHQFKNKQFNDDSKAFNNSETTLQQQTEEIDTTNKEQSKTTVLETKIIPKKMTEIRYNLSCMTSKDEESAMDIVNLMSAHRDNMILIGTEPISIEEEQEYGVSFFNMYKNKVEVKTNVKLSKILSKILKSFSSDYSYKIYEVNDVSVNAFTFGSYIYIHKGMLDFTQNDDELAAVISHEISHNELGHISKNLRVQKTSQHFFGDDFTAFFSTIEQMITIPFNQKDEVMSDLMGTDLLIMSGYEPCSLIQLWSRLAKKENKQNALDELLMTHPYSNKRANCIRNHLLYNYEGACE